MHGDRKDTAVVVAEANTAGKHRAVGVVQLDSERAAFAYGHREVEPAVFDAQFVKVPERLTCEIADLRIVPFALELSDHDDGKNDRVLREAEERLRIAQKHRCVEHVGAEVL